jgi:hypothetical protein
MTVNRLRSIAIEEQRQLMTFGFAVLVFLMTLVALQVHDQGSNLNRVGRANRESASHSLRQDKMASPRNHTVALATTSPPSV